MTPLPSVESDVPILKLDHDDEEQELEFELRFLLSLTVEQRYRMMEEASRSLIAQLDQHGQRKSFEIIKRT